MTDRQLLTLVDLLQPQCTRTYGTAPCTAALGVTGAAKCYNTRATCQDPENYVAGILTLRFCKPQENVQADYGPVFPFIKSLNITPLTINLGGMDANMSPFGRRESVTINFMDGLHSDNLVDKYRTERAAGTAGTTFDPYTSGSFWGKWMARNPYHEGMAVIVRQGLGGDALVDMETRTYVVDRIAGPNDGSVNLVAKDLFSLVEARKSKAPRASRCELRIGITAKQTAPFQIGPPELVDEDYPGGEFYVAINDEIIRVIRDQDWLNIAERGALGTEADDHDGSDKVQLVLQYSSLQAQDILYDLLTEYTTLSPAYINLAEWDAEMTARPELLSAFIAEPTPVDQLIGELAEQVGFSIWPSVTENMIKLKVLQPEEGITPTVDDEYWILRDTFAARRMDTQRVSQVWVYYGQRNPIEDQRDPANYRSRRIFADLEAEGADQYGTPAIREVFSRWIPQYAGTFATTAGNRILSLFRDPPLRATFTLHRRRANELDIAELFLLKTREDQSALGTLVTRTMAPIELIREDEKIIVQAQEVRFFTTPAEDKTIIIEEDVLCFNMRAAYNALYGDPVPGETIIFRVLTGIVVGSNILGTPAIDTGSWPQGIDLRLEIQAGAKVLGRGGNGGSIAGTNGQPGGDALFLRTNLVLDNDGTIGGGGGGGGGATETYNDYSAYGQGGGGAGRANGDGATDGNDSEGGDGSEGFTSVPDIAGMNTPLGPGAIMYAKGGRGGDLGQAGEWGVYGGLSNTQSLGEGGSPGLAINGAGYVFFEDEGTIIGAVASTVDTTFDPAPMAPDNLDLSAQTSMTGAATYATTIVFTFDLPGDPRIISFEAQIQTVQSPGTWLPLYDAYLNRYEWSTAQLGLIRVRVRSVYERGSVYSGWVSTQMTNLGPYEALATIGMPAPIEPKLFVTANPEKSTARIRVSARFDQYGPVLPDSFLIFYSVADAPNSAAITVDTGSKLYIDVASVYAGEFTMPVAAGSTTSALKYENPGNQFDINLVGYWWVRPFDGVTDGPYLKVDEASETTLYFAPGAVFPFTAEVGDIIQVFEANFSDSRTSEFALLYMVNPNDLTEDGEVIRHNGIKLDEGGYYIDAAERGAEGTTQASAAGKVAHYFPAPGPLTNIVEIAAGSFGQTNGQIEFSGEIDVNIPAKMVWAAISCCFARKTADGSRTRYVRSPIVKLTNSGPA